MGRYYKFGLPVAAFLAMLMWLGLRSTVESAAYFKTISEVKQMGEQAQGPPLRVVGLVKEGSIRREGSKAVFLLTANQGSGAVGDSLTVIYDGSDPLPDTFNDHAQALADGKLGRDGVFHANRIWAKCGSFPAEFDIRKQVTLHGRVTRVEWTPRVRIHMNVEGQEGATWNWVVEGGSPSALLRNGGTRNSLPKEAEIVVDGYQARDGAMRAIGRDITFADGRNLLLGSCGLDTPQGNSSDR